MDPRSKDDYFEAGMALLADGGVHAVTIARLCSALGVTKGSFYHHFRGVDDYKTHLLGHWSVETERQVLRAAGAVSDPMERLDVLREAGITLHHEAEVAIRAWSRTDPAAWKVREKVDAARERTVADAYSEVGVPVDVAQLLGRLGVAVLVGAQHRSEVTDRAALREMYVRLHEMTMATFVSPVSAVRPS
ncbi:MAG: helix-turn-helix domain-containing protein [Actinomycetota bacterium]|nr:helix-turn-helix domain-containing protein [Actinomycetota bacterium]